MIADGQVVGDGSWNLTIYTTDLELDCTLRVKGDTHIGGVMLKLVESLEKEQILKTGRAVGRDWSDHALWWPQQNRWLARARSTLDQCGVHADAVLHFTPMHKRLRVQLPDLRYVDCRVDFSIKTFNAVINLCKELGIRHPEELSLCKPLEPSHLKYNFKEGKHRNGAVSPADTNTFVARAGAGSNGSLDRGGHAPLMCAPVTPPPRAHSAQPIANGSWNRSYGRPNNRSPDAGYCGTPPPLRCSSLDELEPLAASMSLADSPLDPGREARDSLVRPKSLIERARMNVGWLDSSLSIMEQGVREHDTLKMRFKFFTFYDLSSRPCDATRVNQLYQQARWQLLNEEIDCTEEEMLVFAALQFQVELQTSAGGTAAAFSADTNGCTVDGANGDASNGSVDDITAALKKLEEQLQGGPPPAADITHVPELAENLRFLKPKRFTLRAFKRLWVVCRDARLRIFASKSAAGSGAPPLHDVELRGVEVSPDACVAQRRFNIRLEVPGSDGMQEMWLRCDNEDQYSQWLAAVRLGARGRSLADPSFASEAASVNALLALQRPPPVDAVPPANIDTHIEPEKYVAQRFLKKSKSKIVQRILENHVNVKDLGLTEAKLQYIRAWQSLPEHGVSLFVVRFMGHKRDELIGIAHNRIMKLDPSNGDHIRTWRFSNMKAWNVNWEIKHMMVQFEEENIIFSSLSADCKVVHEFIGGYIFLSMRSKDANQTLDEELFHKLTGGWV